MSPESLALTVPLLGVPLTLVRLLGAAFLALLSWGFPTATSPADSTSPDPVETPHPFSVRLRGGLHQALTRRFDRVLPWFLLGLVVAALAQVLLGPEPLRSLPTALQVPLLALLGLSVCASPTSATLLATVALHKGSTPGAALVFLWAGASWRWPSSRTPPIPKKHRHQARGALVFGVAMVLGWTLDALPVTTGPLPEAWQTMTPTPVTVGALGFLGLMALSSLFRQGPRGLLRPMFSPRVPPVQGPVSGSSPLS